MDSSDQIPPEFQPPIDVMIGAMIGGIYSFAPEFVLTLATPEKYLFGITFPHGSHKYVGYLILFLTWIRFNRSTM